MGRGYYSRDVPMRQERVERTVERVFTFRGQDSDAVAAGQAPERREVHALLNIKGKKRECRDSKDHPVTTPIVIVMDVTKSRGQDAAVVYTKVPLLIGQLKMNGVVEHPVLAWGAVGDATSGDFAPVQVSQFESDARIDEALAKIWLEEGGGGTGQESYQLLAYAFARRTELDATNRGKKGYLFFLGDEGFYPFVSKDEVAVWLGDRIPADVPSPVIFRELQEKFHVFFIYPKKIWETRKVDIDQEIAGRVRNAGGMVEGVSIRASLLWNNTNDLDLRVICPSGEEIYYGHKNSRCGGFLDVDRNVCGETMKPVENTRWEKGKAPKGHYNVYVQNFATHGDFAAATPFRVEIEIDGKVQHFEKTTPRGVTGYPSNTPVFEFDYDPKQGQINPKDVYEAYKPEVVLAQWGSVLPQQNILVIEDPKACVDVMIGAIAIMEGKRTLPDYLEELKARKQTPARCQDVASALKQLAEIGGEQQVGTAVFSGVSKSKGKKSRRI